MKSRITRPVFLESQTRSAFTLIEILIAVTIIAVLIALLLPAIGAVNRRAKEAAVASEMESIKASITDFKVRFKQMPPSNITISESPAGWGARTVSRRRIKQLWPQFDFTIARDFNGDGDTADSVHLDGAECLVFFLGGMVDGTTGALRGFSKNPLNPFQIDDATREGPFYEFKNAGFDVATMRPTGRLSDTDGDGAPEYLDSLPGQTAPIVYFSSYDGNGYSEHDNAEDINHNGTLDTGEDKNGNGVLDGRIHPYFKDANEQNGFNSDGFQLISPGFDHLYGTGGYFNPEDTSNLSVEDGDNITNFHGGTLGGI